MPKKQRLIIKILKIFYKFAMITILGLFVQIYASQLGLFDDIHIEISGNQFVHLNQIYIEHEFSGRF